MKLDQTRGVELMGLDSRVGYIVEIGCRLSDWTRVGYIVEIRCRLSDWTRVGYIVEIGCRLSDWTDLYWNFRSL